MHSIYFRIFLQKGGEKFILWLDFCHFSSLNCFTVRTYAGGKTGTQAEDWRKKKNCGKTNLIALNCS